MRRSRVCLIALAVVASSASGAKGQNSSSTHEVEFVLKDAVTRGGGNFAAVLTRPNVDSPVRIEVRRSSLNIELVAAVLRIAEREFLTAQPNRTPVDVFFVAEGMRLRPLGATERARVGPTFETLAALSRRGMGSEQSMRIKFPAG